MTDEVVEPPKKRILVIDDQYPLRELLETLLEDDYEVIKAKNAEEARLILRDPVDLIFLDIMMPDFDGYAFCKELKESIATKHIPVLILTAKHQPKDLELAKTAGVDEYLTKPFDDEYLLKRVKILIDRIPESDIPEQGKTLQFGGGFHYVRKRN